MKRLKSIKVEREINPVTGLVLIRFEKPLTSNTGADILAQAVLLYKKLGKNVELVHSINYKEILGVTGEPETVDEVLAFLDTEEK